MVKNKMYGLVYKVEFGTTYYMTREGETATKASWSINKGNALMVPWTRAHKIAMKFNGHLDPGTPWKYGFGN